MSNLLHETVTGVRHWTPTLFSFTTTRDPAFRFLSGQFTMIGLPVDGKPLLRAYSMASPHYDEQLEFFSIKVPDGPLTSRLQLIKEGDEVLVGRKAVGTLVQDSLLPGRSLYLLGTGTGLAPFASIVQGPRRVRPVRARGTGPWLPGGGGAGLWRGGRRPPAGRRVAGRHRARQAAVLSDDDARAVPQPGPRHHPAGQRQADGRPRPAGGSTRRTTA